MAPLQAARYSAGCQADSLPIKLRFVHAIELTQHLVLD